MSDFSQVITQLSDTFVLPIFLSVAAVLVITYLNRHRLRLSWLNLRTRYCLSRLGLEQISGLNCPDGLGHHFTIDRLLLRHDGITLLVTKQYPGRIFCSDHIDDWTQMLGRKSFRFKNPLFELDHQIKAIAACIPDVSVDGYLFFDYQTEFPKGHPQRVIHAAAIPESITRRNRHQVENHVMQAWKKLKALSTQ